MPRVTTVKSARTSTKVRNCRQCGHEIAVGESYKHFTKRFSPTVFYCSQHSPKGSDLVGGKAGDLIRIGEDLDLSLSGAEALEDVESALESAVEEANQLAEELRESVSNIEDGFGHATMVSEELEERADALESWVSELESAKDEVSDMGEDEPVNPDEPVKTDFSNEREFEEAHDKWDDDSAAHAEWEDNQSNLLDNAQEAANSAAEAIPG